MRKLKFFVVFNTLFFLISLYISGSQNVSDSLKYFNQAYDSLRSEDYDSSLQLLYQANKFAKAHQLDSALADFTWKKGFVFQMMSNYDSAEAAYWKTGHIAQQHQLKELEGISLFRIGNLFYRMGKSDSTFIYYNKALNFATNNQLVRLKMLIYNGLGQYHNRKGQYDEAIIDFTKSYTLADSLGEQTTLAHSLLSLGIIYARTGQVSLAIATNHKAILIAKKEKNKLKLAELYNNMSILYRNEREFDSAFYYLKLSKTIAEELGNQNTLNRILMNFGTTYAYQEQFKLAKLYYDSAWMLSKSTGNIPLNMSILQNLSAVSKDLKDYPAAIKYTQESLKLVSKTQQYFSLPDLYSNLYESYKGLKQYDSALFYHELYKTANDSLLSQEKLTRVAKVQAEFEVSLKEKDLLKLKNESLQQSLEITAAQMRQNIMLGVSFTTIIILLLLWHSYRIKQRKNLIIRQKEIDKLHAEKEIQATRSLIAGQESERKRLSQEIHDGVGVILSTASMQLSVLVNEKQPVFVQNSLKKAEELVLNANTSLRRMAQNLLPGVLAKFGLLEAIKDFKEDIEETTELTIRLEITGQIPDLKEDVALMVYRMTQELVNNTLKHAEATNAQLQIQFLSDMIHLNYSDNGIGFDYEALESKYKKPLLWGLQARISYLKGEIDVKTALNSGFSCHIKVPIIQLAENS